jgi:hypothetical protein
VPGQAQMGAVSEDVPPTRRRFFPDICGVSRRRAIALQSKMRTIIVKLPPEANFLSEMAAMRVWLDKHRCSPSRFKYHRAQESVIMQVEFKEEEEAEIFKRYFDGRKAIWILVDNRH